VRRYHYRQQYARHCKTKRRAALTQLNDEETMFQASVRKFARERIAPHVREMDEASLFRKELIREFFDLG
jgi:butyryl-CoA dehydrogenase/short/branched chain acyl-CoA dehydrogenase